MERPAFLEALHNASCSLRDFLHDRTRRWLVNMIATGFDSPEARARGRILKEEEVFEILCYFYAVNQVAEKVRLVFVPGIGNDGFRLPYKPGDKKNFAFFRFVWNGNVYDLCCGTFLERFSSDPVDDCPDISLQAMDSLDAESEPGRVVALWDAKFHRNKRLPHGEIRAFRTWITDFVNQDYESGDILESLLPPEFQVCGLVTNATHMPGFHESLLIWGFSVVLDFDGYADKTVPKPTRVEHLNFLASGGASGGDSNGVNQKGALTQK